MADTLSTLQGDREHDLAGESAPKGVRLGAAIAGPDSFGMGLQVLVADWERSGRPSLDAIRRLHSQRLGKKVFPLVVALADAERSVWLMGPNPDASPVGPLPEPQAARILQASLDELSGLAARQRIAHLLRSLSSSDVVGVTNSGLFATYYLNSVLQDDTDWEAAGARAHDWLNLRDEPLIDALGFSARRAAANALVLTTDSARPRAVAVLLTDTEAFDADSPRFAVSPVAYGLSVAQREDAPWLIVLRGSQIRLYPARPGVGVGSRGQAETYFELDMALVSGEFAAYLDLAFSGTALGAEGTISQLIDGSTRYATGLGERLRQRVYEEAIPTLAVAVAHELERLGHPVGDDYSYAYRITLRILFRLLFQAYAEDRGLLPYGRNDRYSRNALKRWALDLVEQPDLQFDRHSHAIWDDLRQVWGVIDTGNTAWDVPPYNGGLFGTDPTLHAEGVIIATMELDDAAIGHALRHLLVDDTDDDSVGAVDFRALSVREFGTIYEGLLESSLSQTDVDLTLDKNLAYVPAAAAEDVVVRAGEIYFHNASGERKATGSYFTPGFAVEHLLDRALGPALDGHLQRIADLLDANDDAAAAESFFDFRVADLAMGSGHFLVAAVDHMETAMSAFLVEHEIPGVTDELRRLETAATEQLREAAADYEIEPSALLRRQIARRCIYGLDINDVAVELARVAIWIHTFVPGLPMSSLDHNLVCADSLTGIGTIDEAIGAIEPSRSTGQLSIFTDPIVEALEDAKKLLVAAANTSEANKAEVKAVAQAAREASLAAEPTRLIFDAAVAIRTGLVTDHQAASADELRDLALDKDVSRSVADLQPGHLPFLFPEVFLRDNGGFDVLLGNPPWEELLVKDLMWWGLRFPGLRGLRAKERERELARIRKARRDLVAEYEQEVVSVTRYRRAVGNGPYPGLRKGHVDLYQAFAWRNWQLLRNNGSAGLVLPRGALSAKGMVGWRESVLGGGAFYDVTLLLNNRQWVFPEVHPQYTLGLVAIRKGASHVGTVHLSGPHSSFDDYQVGMSADPAALSAADFATWTDTAAFPSLPSSESLDVLLTMRKHPRFDSTDGFEFRPVQGDLNATTGKPYMDFDIEAHNGDVPVLAGASFNLWDPAFGPPYAYAQSSELIPHLVERALKAVTNKRSAYFQSSVTSADDLAIGRARIAFRDIARATDSRTAIFCLVPPHSAVQNKAPYLMRRSGEEPDEAYLLGILSSIPFDWYTRLWVEISFNFYILQPMPIPRPNRDEPLRERVVELAGRLAAVDQDYEEWADRVGVPVGTLQDAAERTDAIAELDALVAVLYGLSEGQLRHIFETFHRGWDYAGRLAAVLDHYHAWRPRAS